MAKEPFIEDVIRAFDSFEDKFVQPGALMARLEKEGFDVLATSQAVDAALGLGNLAWSESRSLFRP